MRFSANTLAIALIAALCGNERSAGDERRTALFAGGITVRQGAPVLFGSPANCSRPGVIDLESLQRATPEWRTIRTDRVRKGSARYDLLTAAMNERIRRAVRHAVDRHSCDCIVRKRDVLDSRGLRLRDVTAQVRAELGRIKLPAA